MASAWSAERKAKASVLARANLSAYRTPLRSTDPDFVPSLRLLVCRERYSLTDIALMFGVSRERARQWCVKYQIEFPDGAKNSSHMRGLFCVRVWDDVAHRFNPVSRGAISDAKAKAATRARLAGITDRRARKRTIIVAHAVRLQAELGRVPSLLEICNAVTGRQYSISHGDHGRAVGVLQGLWGGGGAGGTKARYRAMIAAFAAAGVGTRERGGRGHLVAPRDNKNITEKR